MTGSDPTLHQSYLAFPKLTTPVVNENQQLNPAWHRFLLGIYTRLGGSTLAAPNATYISQAPVSAGAPLGVYDAVTGSLIGVISLQNTGGGPVIHEAPAISPLVVVALTDGTLVADSGKLEVSRDSGVSWLQVSLVGGALSMLKNDQARISWTKGLPLVSFLPILVS